MKRIYGFGPIISEDCESLILGSIPSVKSRENNFYYSNPTNRFWKIMSALYHEDFVGMDSDKKAETLLKNKIALYDVYSSCAMKNDRGSLDSHIVKPKMNDIPKLIKDTKIKKIYITSKKAYLDFVKVFKDELAKMDVEIINLPSPSGANRSKFKTDDEMTNEWAMLMDKSTF